MPRSLAKCPTGIAGFDEIAGGGLPAGRTSLVCGAAGCGKTLFALEFLARGARDLGEPGVFLAFEETPADLATNIASLGLDLEALEERGLLALDHVHLDPAEIAETGDYDLEGLFLRLGAAIDRIGARRVVIDTVESLFAGLSNHAVLRSELNRLFRFLKQRGVTAIVTGERGGDASLTRHGLEEYVSDCVIVLDHRVDGQVSTRRLRIVKYRGSVHGTNEYPFLIGPSGFQVLPITSAGLDFDVTDAKVSSGVPGLDAMLEPGGFYRGSTILVSGAPGTGKTSVLCSAMAAACARGERAVLFSFEESPAQILRNMRSIGLDLASFLEKQLWIWSARPTVRGIEQHLVEMSTAIDRVDPDVVAIDPISNLASGGDGDAASALLIRVVDRLKMQGVTAVLSFLDGSQPTAQRPRQLSSLMDVWVALGTEDREGDRIRTLELIKSRGMAHARRPHELQITRHGLEVAGPLRAAGRNAS